MSKQVMVMLVVHDTGTSDLELQNLLGDVLMYKHDIGVEYVEDVNTTIVNYDWKTANGIVDQEER